MHDPGAGTRRRMGLALLAAGLAGLACGCSLPDQKMALSSAQGAQVALPQEGVVPGGSPYAVPTPAPLTKPLLSADVLVAGGRRLPVERLRATHGVRSAASLSLASVPAAGRAITIEAVDPASYRRFTPRPTARAAAVWDRVAAGDMVLSTPTAKALRQRLGGSMTLGDQDGSARLRVGAFASLPPGVDAVVNLRRGRQLGMAPGNGLLVSARSADPRGLAARLERRAGKGARAQPLTSVPERTVAGADTAGSGGGATGGDWTAMLTGGSVAQAVGSFSYHYTEDGTVQPDPAWVQANIRTEDMPILGPVTGHRVMLPQLRAALREVVADGLASSIDASDFGGCYAPRFIDRDPSHGLSLHTWGIAVDLNVSTNQRGTSGRMDPRVVAIFKKWGFAWGGDWGYTDPMHFELAALVRPR